MSLFRLYKGDPNGLFIFLIGGLPFYTISLSMIFVLSGVGLIPIVQATKEIIILISLLSLWLQHQRLPSSERIQLHLLDRLVIAFFVFSLVYTLLPIGEFGFFKRLLAFKSLSFFPFIYFCGRLFPLSKTYLQKYFSFILVLTIVAACITLMEYITKTHLQVYSGYTDFNMQFYHQEPSGSYGLTWTFEIENGIKRFASFFSTPLEHAASTILAFVLIAAMSTYQFDKIYLRPLPVLALFATFVSILSAISRAALLSYFIIIIVYSFLTKRREIMYLFYLMLIGFVIYLFSFSSKEVQDFVYNSVSFSNNSSLGHVIEWLDGIESMINHPFGMGVGSSGRLTAFEGDAVGGENQFIIVGVQIGVLGLCLYLWIYFASLIKAFKVYRFVEGKEQMIALIIVLLRVGLFLPMFTSNLDAYIYISYLLWLLNGLFGSVYQSYLKKQTQVTQEVSTL